MNSFRSLVIATAAILILALPHVAAHGHEMEPTPHMDMHMNAELATDSSSPDSKAPIWEAWEPSYFRNPGHQNWMLIHIILMILSWCFVMPIAILLSIVRSRYHLPVQVVFHTANGLGLFASFIYNHVTPDLYVNNAHHPLGWVLTITTVIWTFLSICSAFSEHHKTKSTSEHTGHSLVMSPISSNNIGDEFNKPHRYADKPAHVRFSQDSGMFSGTSGSRTNSSDSIPKSKEEEHLLSPGTAADDFADVDFENAVDTETRGFPGSDRVKKLMTRHAGRVTGARISAAIRFAQIVLEKFLLLLGFTAIATGFVTYGGIFRANEAFSGAAHYVKGAIFFWYGLLSLGRWMGAFSELGWAWNLRPKTPAVARWKTLVPSAEFVESFVIWLYGASNVFLERLGSTDGVWAPQDFEHLSITALFFGGGLFGMLLEQRWIRNLLATQFEVQKKHTDRLRGVIRGSLHFDRELSTAEEHWETPETEKVSLNPMPALVIMLLGMMMGGHHQQSMVSTMMHKQWGTLFSGFAMARLVTYMLIYLKPPTSHYPSRPPSELVASFCLIAGGLMFMNSARDSVRSIETNGLDAMTIFTITMGLTGIIMAWVIFCFALKGWARRRESAAVGRALP